MTRQVRPGIWQDGEPALKLLSVHWEPPRQSKATLVASFALPQGATLQAVIINGVRYVPADDA
jgi:hypothetical protein